MGRERWWKWAILSCVVLAGLVCAIHMREYVRVSSRLDVVQLQMSDVTSGLLNARDVIVSADSVDITLDTLSTVTEGAWLDAMSYAVTPGTHTSRAQFTVLHCAKNDGVSASCLITVTHPTTDAQVTIILRCSRTGGGILILPPNWRYSSEAGGCEMTERRVHSPISWCMSHVTRVQPQSAIV